jgi:hypothetical protein
MDMDTTNEPVAWMMVNRENTSAYLTFEKPTRDMKISHEPTPLYTHPVKELTLTEDEIDDVWAACSTGESDTIDMHLFAEAILKKAQEK